MEFSYNKLWKLLIDKDLNKKDLQLNAKIASSTIAKMSKKLPVSLVVLARICQSLNVDIGDILEIKY